MWIQADNKVWDKKLKACKDVHERNVLILRSGKETCCLRMNFNTREFLYRPAIGHFAIMGIERDDNFIYATEQEAHEKGVELRKMVESEVDKYKKLVQPRG